MPRSMVLAVDDDATAREALASLLAGEDCETTFVGSGPAALETAVASPPDLILLDVMMPGMDGFEVCRRLKADPLTHSVPIIMVTTRGEEIDRVIGLELGADDYMVKPISVRELILRVNAVLRRAAGPVEGDPSVTAGPLRIDGPGHRVFADEREVAVTALEFRLILALVTRPGRALSRENLLELAWGIQTEIETRTVDTMMKRLRDKLGDAGRCIETVRGVGYRFAVDA